MNLRERPSYLPTIVVTLFLGIFGLIPALRHSRMARDRGLTTAGYWWSFGLCLVLPIGIVFMVLFVAVFVTDTSTGLSSFPNGPTPTSSCGVVSGTCTESNTGMGQASSGSSGAGTSAPDTTTSAPDISHPATFRSVLENSVQWSEDTTGESNGNLISSGTPVQMLCWTTGAYDDGSAKWFYVRVTTGGGNTYVPANAVGQQSSVPHC
jgi:hypothetical protein